MRGRYERGLEMPRHARRLSYESIVLFLFLLNSGYGEAAGISLAWDANTETDLAGYKVYYGPAAGTYGAPVDVGNVTSYTISGLSAGTYYFALKAYNTSSDESDFSNEVHATLSEPDTTVPTTTITSPTSGSTHSTGSSTLSLSGAAADNVGVMQVTWSNSRGGSGTASGTSTWSISGITLTAGSNVLTVTAKDAAGNSGAATLTVTYTPPDTTLPSISGVSASGIGEASATVLWTTDEASNSQVEYGTTANYGSSSPLNSNMVASHSVTLSNLASSTLYHYRVRSADAEGNQAVSNDYTFTTSTPCTYSISPAGLSFTAPASAGIVTVTAPADCRWAASSNSAWIGITSGESGNGSGTVLYALASNSTPNTRSGSIDIAGHTFTATQEKTGCDINGDANINILDVQSIVNVVLGSAKCPGYCDVSGDGGVNILDLQGLVNTVLGVSACPSK
jgi:hypothetical protein